MTSTTKGSSGPKADSNQRLKPWCRNDDDTTSDAYRVGRGRSTWLAGLKVEWVLAENVAVESFVLTLGSRQLLVFAIFLFVFSKC